MDKIPCEVIRDLIPLVQDKAASEESAALVYHHTQSCGDCRALLSGELQQAVVVPDEVKSFKRLRRRLFWSALAVLVIGVVSGTAMMDDFTMVYNFILFPAVGTGAYFLLRKWCWMAPTATFAAVFLRYFFAPRNISWASGAISGALFGLICAVFIGIGLLIGFLLHFAFKKEGKSS